MKLIHRMIAFVTFCVLLTPCMHAVAPFATLACTGTAGSTLNLPIAAFTFAADNSTTRFFTIYTDITNLRQLLLAQRSGTVYESCTTTTDSMGLEATGVLIVDVTAAGAGPGVTTAPAGVVYAGATFAYTLLIIGPDVVSSVSRQNALPLIEQQALDSFRTRGLALPNSGNN